MTDETVQLISSRWTMYHYFVRRNEYFTLNGIGDTCDRGLFQKFDSFWFQPDSLATPNVVARVNAELCKVALKIEG